MARELRIGIRRAFGVLAVKNVDGNSSSIVCASLPNPPLTLLTVDDTLLRLISLLTGVVPLRAKTRRPPATADRLARQLSSEMFEVFTNSLRASNQELCQAKTLGR